MKAFGEYFSTGHPNQESEFIACAQRLIGSFKWGLQILYLTIGKHLLVKMEFVG